MSEKFDHKLHIVTYCMKWVKTSWTYSTIPRGQKTSGVILGSSGEDHLLLMLYLCFVVFPSIYIVYTETETSNPQKFIKC